MNGLIVPGTGFGCDDPVELLYESVTTRVVRGMLRGQVVVIKQPMGAHAATRQRHESELLDRLMAIEGVVQQAEALSRPGAIVLKDCGGTILSDVLRAGPPETGWILNLATSLVRTLAGVHRAGVVHRDINPANIVVSASGTPVLIDFDLAAVAGHGSGGASSGEIVGTLGYLAPEQTGRTGHAVDHRTDLYSLGVTLYEMVTGSVPFAADDTLQLIHDHLVREPVRPSESNQGVPAGMSAIILRLLAKDPEHRYQSAEGLLHDLRRLRSELECGEMGLFDLGERDFPSRFVPVGLAGREAELTTLQTAFAQAMGATSRTVLIEGPTGVGKSALVHEFKSSVTASNGWIVHGKVDQYQKEKSEAGALIQALRSLGRLLLSQPADVLALQRQRIVTAVGAGADLIAALSREFALILGPQSATAPIDPRQAQLRQQQAIIDLIGAVASPSRPLVIVLDDLQWASLQSLRGFERLMNEPRLGGLLLVGIYRSEGIDAGAALAPMLAAWQMQDARPLHLALSNLSARHSGEMLQRLLRLTPERAQELALAIGVLCEGNPFETVEMANALRKEGILWLDESGWRWDAPAIRSFVGRGDVADLLAARLARLPTTSLELLASMSCLGNSVDLSLLAAAAGIDHDEVRERLRAPFDDGLLVADQAGEQKIARFRHDRVQQAVFATTEDEERTRCQLQMARRLALWPAFEAQAAQQYLACFAYSGGTQLGDAVEFRRAVQLLHQEARQLSRIASYELAERYLAAASSLLAGIGDEADAALGIEIDFERHEALYSVGRLAEGDALFDALQMRVTEPLGLVDAACMQIGSLEARGQMRQAQALGMEMLARLGLRAPARYVDGESDDRLTDFNAWLEHDRQIDNATRQPATDGRVLVTAKLLGRLIRSAYSLSDMDAATWLLCECQRLWVEEGPCPDLIANLAGFYGVFVTRRQDYRTGYELSRHALVVGDAMGWELQTSTARFAFGGFSCHWFEPLENALRELEITLERVRAQGGEPTFASQIPPIIAIALFELAPTIDIWDAQTEKGMLLARQTGNLVVQAMHLGNRRFALALRGLTHTPDSFDDEHFSEKDYLAQSGHLPYIHRFSFQHTLNALILGDVATLSSFADKGIAPTAIGNYGLFHMHMFAALGRAWQLQKNLTPLAQSELEQLRSSRTWMATRAADQPYNFLHLLRLVEAEEAWGLGDFGKAAEIFDDALTEAEHRQRPWHRALISERAGVFHLAHGLAYFGKRLLTEARDRYQDWGARAKVEVMQREHTFLTGRPRSTGRTDRSSIRESSTSVSANTVDLIGVLRASQALSSETSVQRLAARVTEVLAALSGATRVVVLSRHDGQWWLLSPTPTDTQTSIPLAQAADRGLLPMSVFRYVDRTGELLLVDDAVRDDRFARDPYFLGLPHCSLLAAPIAGQGGSGAMVMLENRNGRDAFNDQRLDAVKLIAGQLAVSLANAQLYDSLEQRVQARTRELKETQDQLVDAARRAGRAEIANNVLHNVGNVLNSVTVSANLARRMVSGSRVEGLARAVGLINEHAADLDVFIRDDPRGGTLVPYLNELVDALRLDRDATLADLDRLTRSVDHISYVVATQQSYSGPSSVLETAMPHDLLEEALRLSEDVIARHGVSVLRSYADIPPAALDKPRLLQILVNLIGNASQAMANMPALSRQLVVASALILAETGERLRITVSDQGEGIAAHDMPRIFSHGYTTRKGGHGFGLHSSALAAMEIGGTLTAHSDGPGKGACFALELPFESRSRTPG